MEHAADAVELYRFEPRRSIEGWRLIREPRLLKQLGVEEPPGRFEPGEIDPTSLYALIDGSLRRLEVRGIDGYVRLYIPRPGVPPTLLLNGLVMHRVKESNPLDDAYAKVRAARLRRGMRILDVCTGLGYTVRAELDAGASHVVTIEVSEAVLLLAQYNPYSHHLADPRVTLILGDATRVIRKLRDGYFHRVIHDPPRFNVAGDLYSLDFYRELFRVLRPGGILFHYTGEPMRRRGRGHGPIVRGVIERLRRAGFHVLGYDERALGVVARKPRQAPVSGNP
ncbi:MAG: methyltransferase domain-containing protein [Crenarchaeota archaeon]|nr:methyltransferase domain-containing protein [Thermoproteota archaeon]